MTNLPAGFYEGELYCFPVGLPKDAQFACLPATPAIEWERGKPAVALLTSAAGALFSIQAVWQVSDEALEAARAGLARRFPDAGEMGLFQAAISDASATLNIENGAVSQAFGPQPASGTAANRTVFSERLTAPEKEALSAALGGRAGLLTLRYDATLELDESAGATVSGNLAPVIQALAPKRAEAGGGGLFGMKKKPAPLPAAPLLASCIAAVQAALADNSLTLERNDTANVSETTRQKVADKLLAALAKIVCDKLTMLGADAASVKTLAVNLNERIPETLSFQVSGAADLGAWAAAHGGSGLITDAGSVIPEPSR